MLPISSRPLGHIPELAHDVEPGSLIDQKFDHGHVSLHGGIVQWRLPHVADPVDACPMGEEYPGVFDIPSYCSEVQGRVAFAGCLVGASQVVLKIRIPFILSKRLAQLIGHRRGFGHGQGLMLFRLFADLLADTAKKGRDMVQHERNRILFVIEN